MADGEHATMTRATAAARPPGPRRVGVVDVGSNSVRLVVFEAPTRAPSYFFNEKVLCGLGADLSRTGRLAPEGRRRALAALRRFAALARAMQVDRLAGVATAAVREAEDGAGFVAEVEAECGIRLDVASGADEARLAAQGVLLGWPGASGLVADLGGASLELARVGEGRVKGEGRTFPLGPLMLAGLKPAEARERVDAALEEAPAGLLPPPGANLYLVGGAWRALARLHMIRTGWPVPVLHEYKVDAAEMLALAEEAAAMTPEEIGRAVRASSARLAVVPLGALVLSRLIRRAAPARMAISAFGVREGVLWEHLPREVREEDPLISACAELERREARFPGFGAELADWLLPLFPEMPVRRARLARAACLLNDVSWASHPDYRADACAETVHRANLLGVDHKERAFVAAALRYRYKARKKEKEAPELLSEAEADEARALGRGIRLGAMLAGSVPGALPLTDLSVRDGRLVLSLEGGARDLTGEVVEKRLASLGESLGLPVRLDPEG